jgi:hypothetical protein
MPSVGGDITEIRYSHPVLGSGVFYPKSAEDSEYDLGGFTNSDDVNMVDGGGGQIVQKNRKLWHFSIKCANDSNTRKDLEAAQSLMNSPVAADYTISHSNGSVYGGKGLPVGDLMGNGNTATFDLKIQGGGVLKAIV